MSLTHPLSRSMVRRIARLTLIGVMAIAPLSLVACSQSGKSQSQASSDPAAAPANPAHAGADKGAAADDMAHVDLGPADESFDLRFIDAMILHHKGALIMARQAQQKSTRTEVKDLAQQIMDAQRKEIRQMQAWRKAWYPDAGEAPVKYDAQTQKTVAATEDDQTAMMMRKPLGQPNERFDLRFIRAMVPHHQMAVEMAQAAVQNSQHPRLKALAQQIIDTQTKEIQQLQDWQKAWYGRGNNAQPSAQPSAQESQ